MPNMKEFAVIVVASIIGTIVGMFAYSAISGGIGGGKFGRGITFGNASATGGGQGR